MKLRVSEASFQKSVIEVAQLNHWRVAHFRKAQNARGQWRTAVAADGAGFPDLVLVRDRIIFAELKQNGAYPTPEQREWLTALTNAVGMPDEVLVVVWRPRDWADIESTLTRKIWT